MVQASALLIAALLLFSVPEAARAETDLLRSPYGDLFKNAKPPYAIKREPAKGTIVGGVVPHHSLALRTIEGFYEKIVRSGQKVRRVWLLAPDHFRRGRASVTTTTADWETNAHALETDPEGAAALIGTGLANDDPFMLEREHAVTIHISAITHYFPKARVIPVVPHWRAPVYALILLEKALVRDYRPGDLIILSMDFSHGKTPKQASLEDDRSIAAIEAFDWQRAHKLDIDAGSACALLLKIARGLGASGAEVLERTDSFALSGENEDSCTSYASILFRK